MKRIIVISLLLIAQQSWAQDTLRIEEVFTNALENNFQIKILGNQIEIAQNNASVGNAGLLPTVSVNGQLGGSINNTHLEFASGIAPVDVKNAQSQNLSAGAILSYTLFKGFSGKNTYDKLKLNASAVDAQSRANIESTMLQVANAYYVLARAIDQVKIAESNVAVSQQRYERAKLANEFGTALRTELLAARVDITSDSSDYLSAILNRENAERNLEQLVGSDLGEGYFTEDFRLDVRDWTLEQLFSEAKANNAVLKNRELQAAMAEKDYKISRSTLFPTLTLNGGYNYSNQSTQAGLITSNQANGMNGSIALSYPLFSGFKNQLQRQNNLIIFENRELEYDQQEMQLATDLNNTWASYQQSLRVLAFEESNLKSAELNLERNEELFKSGRITSTQFREAQLALVASQVRISNSKISVKLNELELMRLSGQILKK